MKEAKEGNTARHPEDPTLRVVQPLQFRLPSAKDLTRDWQTDLGCLWVSQTGTADPPLYCFKNWE